MGLAKAYIKNMTWQRVRNLFRCHFSFLLSRKRVCKFKHYPTFLSVEPANWCQLHCAECYVGLYRRSSKGEQMDFSLYTKIIDEIGNYLHTLQLFFQGEPTLSSSIIDMIAYAHNKGIVTIISTNAQKIDYELARGIVAAGLDKIIVSIDGLTQDVYEQYRRGGKLSKALNALKYLQAAKKELHSQIQIELQCLMTRQNEHQWNDLRKQYKHLGADRLCLKTIQLENLSDAEQFLPTNKKHSRYQRNSQGEWVRKKPIRNKCWRAWSGAVITTNGAILPCCFDKKKQFIYGNAHQDSVANIWYSKKAQAFRQQILQDRRAHAMCLNCTE